MSGILTESTGPLTEPNRPRGPSLLIGLGLLELVCLGALGWWPDIGLPFPRLPLFALAFAAYWTVGFQLVTERTDTRLLWAFAVAFRLILLPDAPFLSDDIYRYLWDGHVQLQGINPFRFAPDAPELESIRTTWHILINNPSVPTIYPPFTQLVFALGAALGGSILTLKLLWMLVDLAAAGLLFAAARRTGRSAPGVLVLFAWSPLLVVETAWSGHLDALGLFLLALVVYLAIPSPRTADLREGEGAGGYGVARWGERLRTPWALGAVLALAALTKFAPAAALPPLARRYGARLVVSFGVVVMLLYLPYAGAGSALWTGLATYAEHWRANEGAFAFLELLIAGPRAPRYLAGALVLGVVGWTTLRRFDPERALFWVLGAGLLLSPTLHPWYVLWALPFAALRRSRPWLLLSGHRIRRILGSRPLLADWRLAPAALDLGRPLGAVLRLARARQSGSAGRKRGPPFPSSSSLTRRGAGTVARRRGQRSRRRR